MSAPAIGSIVRDVTVQDGLSRYAIGRRGFLDLRTGFWAPYDSCFEGPEFFDRPEFVIELDRAIAAEEADR